jgi:hypothetical protein
MFQTLTIPVVQLILFIGVVSLGILSEIGFIEYPDWHSYELIYLGKSNNTLGYDYLFKFIMNLFQELNLTYAQFRVVLLCATIYIFSHSIKGRLSRDQLGLIIINFTFVSIQIRQGVFVSLLYMIVSRRSSFISYVNYLIASLFHSKTGVLYLVYVVYKKTSILFKVFILFGLFYFLMNVISFKYILPFLDDYIFHFEMDNVFSLVSLVTPVFYFFLFRNTTVSDRLIVVFPLLLILYSLLVQNILGGKIIVNSILRLLPVFLSVLIISGKISLSKFELAMVLVIFLKDMYSSQII